MLTPSPLSRRQSLARSLAPSLQSGTRTRGSQHTRRLLLRTEQNRGGGQNVIITLVQIIFLVSNNMEGLFPFNGRHVCPFIFAVLRE